MIRFSLLLASLLLLTSATSAQMILEQTVYAPEPFPGVYLIAADFDSDGDDDYLLSDSYIERENGETVSETFRDPAYHMQYAIEGDIDADGDLDFLAIINGSIWQYLNDGSGHFEFMPTTASIDPGDVTGLADVDEDGDLDLVAVDTKYWGGHYYEFINVIFNNGLDENWVRVEESSPRTIKSPRLADIDQDGRMDILCLGSSETVIYYSTNDGLEFSINPIPDIEQEQSYSLELFDHNNDGLVDFWTSTSDGQLTAMIQADSMQFSAQSFTDPLQGRIIQLVDINGDGFADALMQNTEHTYWYFGRPDGGLIIAEDPETLALLNHTKRLVTDYDADGLQDVLHSSAIYEKIAYYSFENDSVSSHSIFELDLLNVQELKSADLNNDGHQDLVIISSPDRNLLVSWSDGSGSLLPPELVYEGLAEYHFLQFEDLSGDGIDDICLSSKNGIFALFCVSFDTEGSLLAAETILQSELGGGRMQLMDYNQDGLVDVLINDLMPRFKVILNDGTGIWPVPEAITAIPYIAVPSSIYTRFSQVIDWNQDELPDLLVYTFSGILQLHLQQEEGLEEQPIFSIDVGLESISTSGIAGDFTGDGLPDVFIGSESGRYIYQQQEDLSVNLIYNSNDPASRITPANVDFNANGQMNLILNQKILEYDEYAETWLLQPLNFDRFLQGTYAISDLDGDNIPEYVGVSVTNEILVYSQSIVQSTALHGKITAPTLLAYPQPAQNHIQIDNLPSSGLLQVCDSQGRVIAIKDLNENSPMTSLRLDTSTWSAGLYILNVEDSMETGLRLVKQ